MLKELPSSFGRPRFLPTQEKNTAVFGSVGEAEEAEEEPKSL